MFNKNPKPNFGFGNSLSTPTSTPSHLPTNSNPTNQKAGGILGASSTANSLNTNNASTPSPTGAGLFSTNKSANISVSNPSGSSTTPGGIFGKPGNPVSSVTQNGTNPNPCTISNIRPFGDNLLNQYREGLTSHTEGGVNVSNPYGLNIGISSSIANTMPDSISNNIGSVGVESTTQNINHATNSRRSVSSIQASVNRRALPSSSNNTLLDKLSSETKNKPYQSNVRGLFTTIPTNTASTYGTLFSQKEGKLAISSDSSNLLGNVLMKDFAKASISKEDLSELRKLKIDPNRSAAKKLKLLSGAATSTKSCIHNFDNSCVIDTRNTENTKGSKSVNDKSAIESNNKDNVCLNEELESDSAKADLVTCKEPADLDQGYWCSPSPEQLNQLSLKQLRAVSNFVIGRFGYGYITFINEVDLTAFSEDFRRELFGKTVIFRTARTVEVYPDESEKPAIGYGLNVPATICLEQVYPIDKKSKAVLKDASRIKDFQVFCRRLRSLRNMEFISYNPYGGVWTFRVNHFSVWGLPNQEDVEVDQELEGKSAIGKARVTESPNAQKDDNDANEQTFDESRDARIYGINFESDISTPLFKESQDGDISNLIDEKPYEPDIKDYEMDCLEVSPELDLANDWAEQLKLAGRSIRSIYRVSRTVRNQNQSNFESPLKTSSETEAGLDHHECNMQGNTGIERPGTIRSRQHAQSTSYSNNSPIVDLQHSIFSNNEIFDYFLLNTKTISRSSSEYPEVIDFKAQFTDVLKNMDKENYDFSLWELASVLFDPIEQNHFDVNSDVQEALMQQRRYQNLCAWVIKQAEKEVHGALESAQSQLEKILLHLMINDISGAAMLAVESNSPHLASIIPFLGSNDKRVKELADLQLKNWSTGGKSVDKYVGQIYKLLTGNFYEGEYNLKELREKFGWLTLLGIELFYGNFGDMTLQEIIGRHLSRFVESKKDALFVLFKIFAASVSSQKFFAEFEAPEVIDGIGIQMVWLLIEIAKHSRQQLLPKNLEDTYISKLIQQLRSLNLNVQAIYIACHLTDEKLCEKTIDSIVYSDITHLVADDKKKVLRELHVPSNLFYNSLALADRNNGNHFGEADNFIKAENFNEAAAVISSFVGPTLILMHKNAPKSLEPLNTLRSLIEKIPKESVESWNAGLGVLEGYVKLADAGQSESPALDFLLDELPLYYEMYKEHKKVPACCNIISQEIISAILYDNSRKLTDLIEGKLSRLPVGAPEKEYLKSQFRLRKIICV